MFSGSNTFAVLFALLTLAMAATAAGGATLEWTIDHSSFINDYDPGNPGLERKDVYVVTNTTPGSSGFDEMYQFEIGFGTNKEVYQLDTPDDWLDATNLANIVFTSDGANLLPGGGLDSTAIFATYSTLLGESVVDANAESVGFESFPEQQTNGPGEIPEPGTLSLLALGALGLLKRRKR